MHLSGDPGFCHIIYIFFFTCSTEIAMLSMQLPFYNTSAKCGFNFLNIFVPIMNNTIVSIQ